MSKMAPNMTYWGWQFLNLRLLADEILWNLMQIRMWNTMLKNMNKIILHETEAFAKKIIHMQKSFTTSYYKNAISELKWLWFDNFKM